MKLEIAVEDIPEGHIVEPYCARCGTPYANEPPLLVFNGLSKSWDPPDPGTDWWQPACRCRRQHAIHTVPAEVRAAGAWCPGSGTAFGSQWGSVPKSCPVCQNEYSVRGGSGKMVRHKRKVPVG